MVRDHRLVRSHVYFRPSKNYKSFRNCRRTDWERFNTILGLWPISRPKKTFGGVVELRDRTRRAFAIWKQTREVDKWDEYKNNHRKIIKKEQR